MYIPVLRGKRFELIALRDSVRLLAKTPTLFPIIEPVRRATISTDLLRAASILSEGGVRFGVVIDPTVGDLAGSDGAATLTATMGDWPATVLDKCTIVFACREGGRQADAVRRVRSSALLRALPVVLLCVADLEATDLGFEPHDVAIQTIIAPRGRVARRLAAGVVPPPQVAEISDPFPMQMRNADYIARGESIFTDEHLYYRAEGRDGFSDYMTIGKEFRDGGGSPNYVAIHWTYTKREPREDGYPIYLQHFCSSDSELDLDTAGKFGAALGKLIAFADAEGLPANPALDALRGHLAYESFPGLGVLKKLSIINHLHVVAGVV